MQRDSKGMEDYQGSEHGTESEGGPPNADNDAPMPGHDEEPLTEDGQPHSQSTVQIPSAMLQGRAFKPGDEIVLKVVATGDDGIEAAYASAPEGGGEMGGAPDAGGQIDAMATEGGS